MEYETREHMVVEHIPWNETCFGCNGGANEGIGMRAYITEDGCVVGVCHTKSGHQGFPETVHGGIIATYFDEVLWHATRLESKDTAAMTVEMNIRYMIPVGIGIDVRVIANPAIIKGRHIYVDGYLLLPDDKVAARADAHYISVRQDNNLKQAETDRLRHVQDERLELVRY